MKKYNYLENVTADVKEYIKNNFESLEEVDEGRLYDDLFIEDSVTGNASGSYYCNTWKAEEAICHNMDLVQEAYEMFGYEGIRKEDGAEAMDVTVRCYLLGQAISNAISELESEEF